MNQLQKSIFKGLMKLSIFLSTILLTSLNAYSQTDYDGTYELGILPGVNWFFGDVGGKAGNGGPFLKDWAPGNYRTNLSLYAAYNLNDRTAIRLTLAGGQLQAKDATLPPQNSGGRYIRNLSTRTDIYESSVSLQYTFRKSATYYYDETQVVAPYIASGAGLVYYEPKAILDNSVIKLRPLRTEGQGMTAYPERKQYSTVAFVLPVNMGFAFQLNSNLSIRSEITFRKVFSDYLDDVSTTYIDPAQFSNYLSGNDLSSALRLHDRSGEINNGVNIFKPGDQRGSPGKKDTWVTFSVGLTYNLSNNYW